MMKPQVDLLELEKQYADSGGNVQHYTHSRRMEIAKKEALEEYERQQSELAKQENKRLGWAKGAGDIAGKGLGMVAVGFTFVFVLLGSIAATLFLFAAELIAVWNGVSVIEPVWAWLYSGAIVSFYIVILFIQEIVIARFGYVQRPKTSIRLIWADFCYFLGIGKDWQTQYEALPDNVQAIGSTVKLSTYAIITFGLLGRLDGKIGEFTGMAWYEAIQEIVTKSSLEDMIGYAGMLVATAALLYSTKWVISFMYSIFKNVTGGVNMQDFTDSSLVIYTQAELVEMYQAKMLQREILKLEAKNPKTE